MGQPSRGYSWAPFEPGNTVSMVHGADSDRAIAERATDVRRDVLAVAPWLDQPEYTPAISRWLRAESRALMLHDHITKVSADKGTGAVSSRTWEQCTAADRLAAKLGSDLGLDPLGRARLMALASTAQVATEHLSDLRQRGAALVAAQQAAADKGDDAHEQETT